MSLNGDMVGGALLKEFPMRSRATGGDGIALTFANDASKVALASQHMCDGKSLVGYIDCCAAEPYSRAGGVIWDVVSKMPYLLRGVPLNLAAENGRLLAIPRNAPL